MAKTRAIDPRDYVEPGTGLHQTIGYILFFLTTGIGAIVFAASTFGIGLIVMAVGFIFYLLRRRVALAQLRGSALRIGPKQFPEIYEYVADLSEALDMDPPDVYLVESNQQNAFAVRIGAKQNVVLFDDIVHGSRLTKNPDVLRFIIAHELAHHALGHTGLIRSQISMLYRPLARLDELSCDAVGAALVGFDAGRDALSLLLVGPQLFAEVSRPSLERQAIQVEEDRLTKKAERQLFYPLMLRRIARMIPDEDDRDFDSKPKKASSSRPADRDDGDDYEDDRP
ncbi:M48 family metallopeptidase [Limnoglobus roseus]|uniref:Protease HtpX n=1 Tax=Limnoglobus roseus TaxID=2598579 RepID=A0A5C1ACD1_9BACT|nr:M48 family metallopeptidase [Limnoglobus roseus]QEL17049.1 Protease HtpX [Limnoglobus roseus]